ncbi:MAG TPA: hypothetical protein VNS63_13850 [Blastocatellia bacterium]|nr:hypothetical protein [Blastocatellia bacterium]
MEKEREIRLRRRIEELVRSRVGLLEQDISNLQREVNESFTRLLERTDTAGSIDESNESLGHIAAEVNAQIDQAGAESVRLGADIALLRDSVAELDGQRSQADVLNSLVARAANFAPRLVLFVVKGTNALAWAARGLDDARGVGQIRGLSISLQADTALRTALNSQQTFYGSADDQTENELIFARLGEVHPQRVMAVPLKVRGKCAAVVYADTAERGEYAANVEAIELLVQTAGLVVELVSMRARMSEAAPAPARPAASPSASEVTHQPSGALRPEATADHSRVARPEAYQEPSTPESVAYVEPHPAAYAETTEYAEPQPAAYAEPEQSAQPEQAVYAEPQQSAEPGPVAYEHQQSVASDHFEAVEATVVEAPSGAVTAVPEPAPEQPIGAVRTGPLDDEEKLHNDARRFARLLVSEIKLYNEQKVTDGRRNNDLYGRLRDDIERSRQMYEKRVTPAVAQKVDYFYDELVKTLAEGDVGKLGSDSPGPSVSMAG